MIRSITPLLFCVLAILSGIDGQFMVSIVSNPAGTPVNGSTNTFDYPILSSVTLTCMVDPSPPADATYQWNTRGCFTSDRHAVTCFPTGQTTQNVTDNNLLAEDAGTITCTVTIGGRDYISGPLTLRISGIVMINTSSGGPAVDLTNDNQITDYKFIQQPFTFDSFNATLRCASGLGPSGGEFNTKLGGWYFSGSQISYGSNCLPSNGVMPVIEARGASVGNYPGVINLYLCGTFTTTEEGVYSCIMMNSSMMEQTVRVGVYFSGRTAPMIDPPSPSTVTIVVGSPLTLSCTSQLSPPDTFTWRKDSGPIVQSTSITTVTHTNSDAVFRADYFVNSTTTSDSGTYTCTVTNPIGSDSEIITVTVVVPTVTIVSNPAGTPVSGSPNTFDYPILSNVTLKCMVDPSSPADATYQWNTGGCFTNTAHNAPMCFPTGEITQVVTGYHLLAEDAGTITCTVTINGLSHTSGPLTLRISGIAIFRPFRFTTSNQIMDYSFFTQPFIINSFDKESIFRCATGLGPSGTDSSTDLGGWYFNGVQLSVVTNCNGSVFGVRAENDALFPGGINLLLCGTFTTTEEGVYSCIMMNSSMMNQTMRVGVYFSERTVPMIDSPSSTVTVDVGSPLTLSCTSRGSPPDTFTWRKDSGPIVQSTSITAVTHTNTSAVFRADYSINSVTTSDSGTYTCTVTNPIGSDSEMFNVTVVSPFDISLPGPIQGAMVGNSRMIQCTVSEVESGSVMFSWVRPGGDTITNDRRVTITGTGLISILNFAYLMEGDEGTYTCNVMSSTGISGSESVEIETLTVPAPSVSVTATSPQRVGQSLTLTCSVTTVRGITSRVDIIWRSGDMILNRTNDTSLETSLMYTDSYTIPTLNITDDGTQYHCVVVINTNPPVTMDSNIFTLDVADSSSGGSSGGGSGGAIAGGVIGAILAVIVIAAIVVFIVFMIRRRRSHSQDIVDKPTSFEKGSALQSMTEEKRSPVLRAPMIMDMPSQHYVTEGVAATFPCYVSGQPTPWVYWYLNNRDMTNDDDVTISEDGQLTLAKASKQHEGEWKCQATNSEGTIEQTMKVQVKMHIMEYGGTESPLPLHKMADKSIHINEFEAHVEGMHHNFNAQFESRFKMLYSGHDMPVTVGTKREHKPKNRFANIVPYDSNRVKLVSYEDSGNDYVNASPVDGYKKRKRFIAAQAPLKMSVVDFWSVIWEERVTTIVMLTNIKEGEKLKCFQYWPETVGGEVEFKPFKVSLLEENRYSEYLIRKFNITKSGESFDVTQFHYIAWPDHGVPEYATGMLGFYRRIRGFHSSTKDPMLVHCSAGVGRTGTFIALDIVLRQVKNENVVDIHNVINKLRHQRPQMVQSLEQYIFIHDAVLEFITCGDTSIEAPNVMRAMAKLKTKDRMTGLTGYEQELKILNKVSPRAEDVECPSANTFPNKNRPGHCLPVERCRVPLKQSYINASYANGYKQSRAYIIAQSPMANTIRDFWKMISDKQCATVVMLCELLEDDEEVCACYWPRTGVNTFDDVDVELTGGNTAKHFTTRTMKVTDNKTKKSHQVTQFQYHGWLAHKPPSNSTGLISMLEEVQKVQRSTANKPIVVHCSNGLGRSSTFCAIYTTLERFKAEQCVDIFQVVKSLRINRPGAVDSLGMYQFIFEVVLRYMQSFETYSNFSV